MSFHLVRPSPATIAAVLDAARHQPLSYQPVGLSLTPSAGYWVDDASVVLGEGDDVFRRARRAFEQWRQFELGWAGIFPPNAPIAIGTVVVVQARALGLSWLHACRIVLVRDDPTEFSFAYGTLTNHAETGEEIFRLKIDPVTAEVRYDIRAVSRAHALLARLGGPVPRLFQARFRRDSLAAMQRAVARTG